MGLGLPKFPSEEVQRTAQDTMETFTPVYLKAFGRHLVEQIKKEREPKEEPRFKLATPPIPREPLRTGSFQKLVSIPASTVNLLTQC